MKSKRYFRTKVSEVEFASLMDVSTELRKLQRDEQALMATRAALFALAARAIEAGEDEFLGSFDGTFPDFVEMSGYSKPMGYLYARVGASTTLTQFVREGLALRVAGKLARAIEDGERDESAVALWVTEQKSRRRALLKAGELPPGRGSSVWPSLAEAREWLGGAEEEPEVEAEEEPEADEEPDEFDEPEAAEAAEVEEPDIAAMVMAELAGQGLIEPEPEVEEPDEQPEEVEEPDIAAMVMAALAEQGLIEPEPEEPSDGPVTGPGQRRATDRDIRLQAEAAIKMAKAPGRILWSLFEGLGDRQKEVFLMLLRTWQASQ